MIIVCLVILGLIGYVTYNNFKPKALEKYNVTEVYRGDIQTAYETTGTVVSSGSVTYTALEGVKVDAVNVSVGDTVKEGDILATFDTTPLNKTLAEYRSAYTKAKAAYDAQLRQRSQANSAAADAKQQIAQLDAEIAALQAEINAAEQAVNGNASQESAPSFDASQVAEVAERLRQGGFTAEEIAQITSSLQSQSQSITYEDIEKAVENSAAAKRAELASKQSQRQLLEAEINFVGSGTDDTAMSIYKSVMEQKKADYDNYKSLVDKMTEGWVAEGNGIVTEVNLVAGETFAPESSASTTTDLSSLLGYVSGNADMSSVLGDIIGSVTSGNTSSAAGIKLENNDELMAEFSVGKYDILNIKTGQKVNVRSLGSEYEGEVVYVSATASETSAFDISSIASTFTGGSTSTANGALVRIKILKPDEKVIIGFDVDIQIDTQKIEDVLVIPIDAVITEDGVNFVYTLDEDNCVHKTEIVVGNYSDSNYELISGIPEGTTVVDNPKTAIKDGEKISPIGA